MKRQNHTVTFLAQWLFVFVLKNNLNIILTFILMIEVILHYNCYVLRNSYSNIRCFLLLLLLVTAEQIECIYQTCESGTEKKTDKVQVIVYGRHKGDEDGPVQSNLADVIKLFLKFVHIHLNFDELVSLISIRFSF